MPDNFTDLLAIAAVDLHPTMQALRTLILRCDPLAIEVIRLGDRAASYGPGPKKMSEAYTYILPYTTWVNLGFYRGAALHDPAGLLAGTGAQMRHVRIDSPAACTNPAIAALLDAARNERLVALAGAAATAEK